MVATSFACLFEKENTEAGCQQCHARDRVTQGATTLNLGRDLQSAVAWAATAMKAGDRDTDALAPHARQLPNLKTRSLQTRN
jgi:hypothetical protein